MAELNDGGGNGNKGTQSDKDAANTAAEITRGAEKAGKAIEGAAKGFAKGGPAGAVVGAVVNTGFGRYCMIGCGIGCAAPFVFLIFLIGFLGSLITGWFFGTNTVKTPEEDPGTLYSMYAEEITECLSEMYCESIYSINDEIHKMIDDNDNPTSNYSDETKITTYTTENNVIDGVVINDENIVDGSEVEIEDGVTYDIDLTDEVCFIIAAYSLTQPYGATTTDDAEDVGEKITNHLKSAQLFEVTAEEPVFTEYESNEDDPIINYKQATDEDDELMWDENGDPIYETDEDGNLIIESEEITKTTHYNLEFTIEGFKEDIVYEMFNIDRDARYIDLIEQTTGDDTQGGIIVYTFNNFMELTSQSALEGDFTPKNKNEDAEPTTEKEKESQRAAWLDSQIGPFMYVGLNDSGQTDEDGKTTYPDEDGQNLIDYVITVYNNSYSKAIAVVEDQMDTTALEKDNINTYINQGTLGGSFQAATDPEIDEETGMATWEFTMENHTAAYVELTCISTEGAYDNARIDNTATVSLYEGVVGENDELLKDDDGNFLLGDLIYKQDTNKTQISTLLTDQCTDPDAITNEQYVEDLQQSIMDTLRNEDDPTENMEEQSGTVTITGADGFYISQTGMGSSTRYGGLSGYAWPLEGSNTHIDVEYGWHGSKVHYGIDIYADEGDYVLAANSGTVIRSEYNDKYGNLIAIEHDDGRITLYCCLSERLVEVGKELQQGEKIGKVGSTGTNESDKAPHLHFEVINSESPYEYPANTINPSYLFQSTSVSSSAIVLDDAEELRQEIIIYAQSFVDKSPYVTAGHGYDVGNYDQTRSKSITHLKAYFNDSKAASSYSKDAKNAAIEVINNHSGNLGGVWKDLDGTLKSYGYDGMPAVFDCCGLTAFVYNQFGFNLGGYSTSTVEMQYNCGMDPLNGKSANSYKNDPEALVKQLKPGDLIFTNLQDTGLPGHVILYLGNDMYVSASGSPQLVKKGTLSSDYIKPGDIVGVRRILVGTDE